MGRLISLVLLKLSTLVCVIELDFPGQLCCEQRSAFGRTRLYHLHEISILCRKWLGSSQQDLALSSGDFSTFFPKANVGAIDN